MNRLALPLLLIALYGGAAGAAPGDSAKQPLAVPPSWGVAPSGRAVLAIVIEGESTDPNGWGIGVEGTLLQCRNAIALGMTDAMPTIDAGADQPNRARKVNYVAMAGNRFFGRSDYQNYRPDGLDDTSASSTDVMCRSHYGYAAAHTTVVRHIDGGDRVSTWEAPSDGRATLARVRSRNFGIVPLLNPGEPLMAGGGAAHAGFKQVAGWRCQNFAMPDHSQMCLLVAQPGIPAMLVGYKMLQTPPPDQPPAAQFSLRVNRLQPGVWVDAAVFTPPPADYTETSLPGSGRASAAPLPPQPALPANLPPGLANLPALLNQVNSARPAASAPSGGRR